MLEVHGATVLLQWSVGGLLFLWVTTRRREVGLGYGWTMRGTYALLAVGAAVAGFASADWVPLRELSSIGVAVAATVVGVLVFWRQQVDALERLEE